MHFFFNMNMNGSMNFSEINFWFLLNIIDLEKFMFLDRCVYTHWQSDTHSDTQDHFYLWTHSSDLVSPGLARVSSGGWQSQKTHTGLTRNGGVGAKSH